jgi:hypothetical protein
MVAALTYAFAVNFVPAYRDPADKIGQSDIGIVGDKEDEESATKAPGEKTATVSVEREDTDISHIEKKEVGA